MLKMFDRWDVSAVKVTDPGLQKYVNLKPVMVPRSFGRVGCDFRKNQMSIVERFMNKLMVPGHMGKRHKIFSGHCTANYQIITKSMIEAFEKIEKQMNQNPVQVLVTAIENAAFYEEITAFQMGGMIARKGVITSPQRRVDVALRLLTQGIFRSGFRNKKTLTMAIADEIMKAAKNDASALAIRERQRLEKEAEGAR